MGQLSSEDAYYNDRLRSYVQVVYHHRHQIIFHIWHFFFFFFLIGNKSFIDIKSAMCLRL